MSNGAYDSFALNVQGWVDRLVKPYLEKTENLAPSNRTHEFNDPVWGTISLQDHEVLVLNAPPHQRLRRVKQLGVADLVFPGATHTRFEHVLGTVHQAEQQLLAIERHKAFDPSVRAVVRMAALCHDLGHGLLSHVSEKAIHNLPSVVELRKTFAGKHKASDEGDDPSIAEIASYLIVTAPSFSTLLNRAFERHAIAESDDCVADIAGTIIGEPLSLAPDFPLIHQIVSGPYDADKLDYLARDSLMAGVPNVVDVGRLTQKITVVEASGEKLPEPIQRRVKEAHAERVLNVTAVESASARSLDELALARALLHDKIYSHQKVRASEAMVGSILLSCIDDGGLSEEELVQFALTSDDMSFTAQPPPEASEAGKDLHQMLKNRDILSRAYSWTTDQWLSSGLQESQNSDALREIELFMRRADDREKFEHTIAQRLSELADALGMQQAVEAYADGELHRYVRISPPPRPKGRSLLEKAYIDLSGKLVNFSEVFSSADGWADYYIVNRHVGYVFAPSDLRELVFLASEAAFSEEFELLGGSQTPNLGSSFNDESVDALRRKAFEAGFYDDKPTDLRPLPAAISSVAGSKQITEIVRRFAGYTSPATMGEWDPSGDQSNMESVLSSVNEESPGVNRPQIEAFIKQFNDDDLAGEVASLIDRFVLLTRPDIRASFTRFLGNLDRTEDESEFVVPLGSARDSSAIVAYDLRPVSTPRGISTVAAHEIPADPGSLIFVDDFISSGRQALSIVQQWFGIDPSDDLGEERGQSELSAATQNAIRASKLHFFFAAGMEDGRKHLTAGLKDMELDAVVHLGSTELPTALADPGPTTGESLLGISDGLRDRLEDIGRQLLEPKAKQKGWEPAVLESRTLGYGNHGLTLVFPWNTPSQTLTAFWAQGNVDGRPWRPLFPRLPKK